MKKGLSLFFVLVLLITIVSGCGRINFTTGLKKDEVYKIDSEICKLPEAELLLAIKKSTYENSFGNTVWEQEIGGMKFEDYVKRSVKNELSQLSSMKLLAIEKNITLTTTEKQNVSDIAKLYFDTLSPEIINELGLTIDVVKEIVGKYAISQKVYENITKNLETEISDVDAKVIKVQQIYIKIEKESQKKEALQQAKDVYEQIKDGEDFSALAEKYSDDKTIEYSFCRSEVIEEFSEAAFALTDGEVSGIIEADNGYYLIKCISSYLVDESIAKKAELIENKKAEVFKNIYNPFVNTLATEFNDDLWEELELNDIPNISNSLYDVFEANYK